jgi:hypothetical protein
MPWRSILWSTVLAAGCVTSACREAAPSSLSPVKDPSQSGAIGSPTAPRPADPPSPPLATGGCDASKALWTVGQPASREVLERARVDAGAESARFLRPNDPVTMEYLGSRLNLGLDARDVVRSVVCG